ncbi:hypothetical protein RUM44_001542 [Polyplax serrata]|uniref:Chitin-binding type-2 domain-containing protein n=1 Tax=Polyplax serrata TaxID=468196 RepID=A0ABR1AKD4_POLSC
MATALASAQRRYYSLEDMPETNFDCRDKILGGYYADPEANCQMFHVCVKIPGQGVQDFRFLCPNETAFDQENQICADSGDIDCEASGLYLENFDLYRLGSAQAKRPVSTVGNGKGAVLPLGPSTKSPILTNNVYEDDDFYLQRSESGDRRLHSKDLLRGSSSSNFFNNRNKGKDLEEDDEDTQPKRPENNGGNNNNQFRPRPNSQLRPKTQYQSQFRKAEQQNPTVQTTTQQPTVGNQNQLNDKKRTKIAVRKLTRKRPEDEVDNRSTQQPQEPQTGFSPFSTQVTQKFGVSDTRYSTIKRPTTTPATFAANGETSFKQQTQQGQQQQQQQQNGQNAFGNTQSRQNNFGASNTLQQQQQQQNAQSSFGNTQNRQTNFGATSTQQQQQQNGQNSFLSTQNRQSNFGASNTQQQQQNAQSSFGNVNSQNRQINFGSSNTQQQQFQNSQTNVNVNAQQNRQGNAATGNFQQQQQQQQQTQSRFQNFKRTEQTTPAFFEPSPTAGAVSKSSEANTDTTAFSLLRNPIVAAGPGYNANLNRQTTNFQQGRQSTANFPSPTPAGVTQIQQQQQNRQSNTETFNYSQQQQQNRQAGANVAAGFSQQRQSGAFQQQQTNGGTFQQTRQQTQQTATSGAGFQQQNRQQTTVTTGNFQQQNKQEVNTGSFQQQARVQQTQTTAGATQQTQGRQQQNQANNGNFQQGRQQTQGRVGNKLKSTPTATSNFNSQQGFNGQQTYNSQQSAQVSSGSANGQSRQSNAGATNFQQQNQNSQSNFRNGNTQQQFQQQQNKQSSYGTTSFQQQQQPQQTFNTQVNRQSQRQTFRTYEEFDDGDNQEFLKTAPSNNFRPSDLNSFTSTYKSEEKVNTTRSGEVSTTKYITPTIVTTSRTTPAYDTPPQPRQNFFSGQSSTGQPSGFYNPTVSTTQRAVSGVSATSPAPSSKLPQRIYPSPTPAKAAEAAKDTAYDYAYYDDSSATFPDYGGFDHLGDSDFSRTIQRTKSRLI